MLGDAVLVILLCIHLLMCLLTIVVCMCFMFVVYGVGICIVYDLVCVGEYCLCLGVACYVIIWCTGCVES